MKIWQLSHLMDRGFETLILTHHERDFSTYFFRKFNGKRIGDDWSHIPVESLRAKSLITDCTGIGSSIPIFSEKALHHLNPFLDGNAEALPLIHPQRVYYAINVTTVLDCLDYEQAVYHRHERYPQIIKEIDKYVFSEEIIGDIPIFKMPSTLSLGVFVTDVFKQAVEEADLKGFHFELMWDSSAEEGIGGIVADPEQVQPQQAEPNEFFSFDEAQKRIESGVVVASGEWRLKQDEDGGILLGRLYANGELQWMSPIYYPPILLDMQWHVVGQEQFQ